MSMQVELSPESLKLLAEEAAHRGVRQEELARALLEEALRRPANDAWDMLAGIAGSVDAPEDWSAEHDHYIHGTPRSGSGRP